jgi:hypothetical protein
MREALQTAFALNSGFGNPNVEKPLWFQAWQRESRTG